MIKYPVHERFFSWQGEGVHMGRSAFFVRLFGCPVHCPWCDSAGTWHPDHIPAKINKMGSHELVAEISEANPEFVVITGGEPAIHDLNELTKMIHQEGYRIHLETSGAFPIRGDFDWITVSPKALKHPILENISLADEIKIIVEDEKSLTFWWDMIQELCKANHVWLHPEWSKRQDPVILSLITQWIKSNGTPFRAGYQLHKLYNADELDPRSIS
jgi:organic radical activating enzyme